MKFYLAPMEGITGFVFRRAYHETFCPMDKYFTPFLSPRAGLELTPKEMRDILPENNIPDRVVPQLLTNRADDFHQTATELAQMGYREININLGCPSGTVFSKHRGAGFLSDPTAVERFLDGVFEKTDLKVSVKTRIGVDEPWEFEDILKVYNKFPLTELIIHPRVRNEFYKGEPHRDVYLEAERNSANPLCYNGDLYTVSQMKEWEMRIRESGDGETKTIAFMFGRGILRYPALINEFNGEAPAEAKRLIAFSERLFEDYSAVMGENNAVFRMKELWSYMVNSFDEPEKSWKRIKKATEPRQLREVLRSMTRTI